MNTEGPICIIPARGGSRRIPRKNIREFRGWPIIWYSLAAASRSALFSRIIASTDDDEVIKCVERFPYDGTTIQTLRRDPVMALDHVGTQDVVRHVLHQLEEQESRELRHDLPVCCLYATAPLMSVLDLWDGMHIMLEHHAWCLSVGTQPLADAGQFYWGKALWYKQALRLLTTQTRILPVDPARVCDVNTEEDWQRALRMYDRLLPNQRGRCP